MNINNKLVMMVSLVIMFFVGSLISSKYVFRIQDLGQVFGLGGVVVGYFVTKIFKR